MAETVLYTVAQDIIRKLSCSVWDEIKLWWGVKDELEDLKTTVSTIQAVLLHAEEQSMQNSHVQNWLASLSEAMYDVDDLLNDFATQAVQQQEVMSGSIFAKEVRLFFSRYNQISYGLKMAHQIKDMRDRLEKIKANKGFFLEERPVEAPVTTRPGRDQTHSSPPTVVVGREHDKKAIIDLLLSSNSNYENVSIISIVGIGGLGKTTLAQLVYNDPIVKNHFELQMWACVSDDFNLKSIVKSILESATKIKTNHSSMDALRNILHENINGKRYLLVLDDVWNEDVNKWSGLKDLLAGGVRGSKIVITTRLKTVADMTRPIHVHPLEGLSEKESWSLFKQKAFKPEQVPSPSHEALGKEIVAKCKGVPLAIDTIAAHLFFRNSESEWLEFMNKDLSKVEQHESDILPTLRLSYNHLPSHLKHCFAYCSLFPKDYMIDIETLIQLWMAQGYVTSSDQSQSLRDIGLGYFMDLYWRSFFQDVEEDEWGDILSCKMHDLMHDLATLVAGEECVLLAISGRASIKQKTRHVSIEFDSHGNEPYLSTLLKARKVRALLSLGGKIPFTGEELDGVFRELRCLRVLSLRDMEKEMEAVPGSIYKLKHLRYLDISENGSIKKLSNSITKLHNLQVLKLNGCSELKQLPKDVKKLVNLVYLDISDCNGLTHMPRGIGQLTRLEQLPMFVIAKDNNVSKNSGGLDELGGLNMLRGELEIVNLRNVKNGASAANLKDKQHLQRLVLAWNEDFDNYNTTNEEMVLEELRPHHNLKELSLWYYGGVNCPSWLPFLVNLVEIEFAECKSIQRLPPLDHLPSLQRLVIMSLPHLQHIELSESSSFFFRFLIEFSLEGCPNLEGFDVASSSSKTELPHFPCLFHLEIKDCPNLKWMPRFPSLQNLELGKHGVSSLKNILANASSSSSSLFYVLSRLSQLQLQQMEDFEEELLQNLTSLRDLEFRDCQLKTLSNDDGTEWEGLKSLCSLQLSSMPNLETLPKGLQHVATLRYLQINGCDNLKGIPEWMPNLTLLQYLGIYSSPHLSERCNNNKAVDWPYIAFIPNITIEFVTIQQNGCYRLSSV